MKATIFLMFSFIFISGALFGQKDSGKPDLYSPEKIANPTLKDLDRFGLYPDSPSFKDKKVTLYSDFVVVEEFPVASRFYSYPFIRQPDKNGKILIIKPDTSENVKYHLIIKDPIRHPITK